MMSPKIDPTFQQLEVPRQNSAKTSRRDAKSTALFREALEETATERSEQRPKAAGRSRSKETANRDETATDIAAMQGPIPPISFGQGKNLEPTFFASNSVTRMELRDTRKECASPSGRSLPPSGSGAQYFLEEAKPVDSKEAGAPRPNSNFLMADRGSLTKAPGKGADTHQSHVRIIGGEEPRQVAIGVPRQIHVHGFQAEDDRKANAVASDRPESPVHPNPGQAKIAEPSSAVRNVISRGDDQSAQGFLGYEEAFKEPASGQAENFPNTKPVDGEVSNIIIPCPPGMLAPAKQICDFISNSISITSPREGQAAEPDGRSLEKSLYLELHPESLGKVRLSMQLRGNELRIRIEAKSQQASEAIEQDRSLLSRLLGEAGFRISSQDIRIETQAMPGGGLYPDAHFSFGAKAHGSGESERDNAERHEPARRQAPYNGNSEIETSGSAHSSDLGRSGVYI